MNYQLVLQWPASAIEDFDGMVEMETLLIEYMSNEHEVDGHDAGSGEMNIFIRTDNPESAFSEAKTILDSRDAWADVRVAYREVASVKYTALWPADLKEFEVA